MRGRAEWARGYSCGVGAAKERGGQREEARCTPAGNSLNRESHMVGKSEDFEEHVVALPGGGVKNFKYESREVYLLWLNRPFQFACTAVGSEQGLWPM